MVFSYGFNQVILRQNRNSLFLYGPVSYYLDNDSHSVKPASSKAGNSELYPCHGKLFWRNASITELRFIIIKLTGNDFQLIFLLVIPRRTLVDTKVR